MDKNMPSKNARVVVKLKNGDYCNLDADYIHEDNGNVQVWRGEQTLVGIFTMSEVVAIYMTEKANKE